ncbi:MAG: HNH endonuclease [Candidatus Brocadiaceae bacterium]|nr:HNH endonuclease [Candidatus Brocadiaceae bacterium]
MPEWIHIEKDPKHIAREKLKARELRKSQWWKNKISQGKCYYCQNTFPSDDLTMDHVIPLTRGGKSRKGNIVPCCKACNNKKKYLTPAEIVLNKLKKQDATEYNKNNFQKNIGPEK